MDLTRVVSVKTMRDADAKTIAGGVASRELMLRAAQGIFNSVGFTGRVAIVCGSGNNGGDGYALACLLLQSGITPTLFRVTDRFTDDGAYYYNRAKSLGCEEESLSSVTSLTGYDIVVDCILGTGFRGEPDAQVKDAIEKINSCGAFVISADINSGLNGDTGEAVCAVYSDLTVSIGSFKTGMFLGKAPKYIDRLCNVDIGIEITDESSYFLDYSMLFMFEGYNSSVMSFEEFFEKSGCDAGAADLADFLREYSINERRPVVVKGEENAVAADLNYVYFCAEYVD